MCSRRRTETRTVEEQRAPCSERICQCGFFRPGQNAFRGRGYTEPTSPRSKLAGRSRHFLASSCRGKLAERGGFEPPIGCYTYNGLANRPLRPLGHLSESGADQNRARVECKAFSQSLLIKPRFGPGAWSRPSRNRSFWPRLSVSSPFPSDTTARGARMRGRRVPPPFAIPPTGPITNPGNARNTKRPGPRRDRARAPRPNNEQTGASRY